MTATRWIILAVCAAGLLLAGVWHVHPSPPYEPVFHDRAVANTSRLRRLWPQSIPQEVIDHHQAVAERVLLVRDTAVVNHPDFDSDPTTHPANGAWSFASVLRLAFRLAGAPDQSVQGYVDQWRTKMQAQDGPDEPLAVRVAMGHFDDAWKLGDTSYALESAPVHLLAIVNRLDLARVDRAACQSDAQTGVMRGAEIRFVYAALPVAEEAHYLSLIVEFVLPCLSMSDFKDFANNWSKLETLDWSPSNSIPSPYQEQLKTLLSKWTNWTQPGTKPTRLRINANSGAGTWDVREFSFQANKLSQENLEREPYVHVGECQVHSSPLGVFLANKQNLDAVLASNHEFDTCLSTKVATILPDGRVLTLASDVASNATRDEARLALSINSCTGCHGPETRKESTSPDFHQIFQRQPKDPSALSAFLTGAQDCQPHDGPIPPLSPEPSYCTVTPRIADRCSVIAADRRYNDLLRRHLFLYTVRNLDPAADDATWKNALDGFAAFQSH